MLKNKFVNLLFNLIIIFLYLTVGILGIPEEMKTNDSFTIVIGYTIIGFLFIFIIVMTNWKTLKHDFKNYFSHFKKYFLNTLKYLALGVGAFMVARTLTSFVIELVPSSNDLITSSMKLIPLYVIFITVIYTPFVEEMIFRKTLFDLIKNKYIYILISAISFGYLHIAGDFSNAFEFFFLILPVVLFGGVIAYSYVKMKNIFVPIFIHFLYNLFLLLLVF